MSLTLLKSAAAPDPRADKGLHKFKYSLFVSDNGVCQSDVVRCAYELNCPICVSGGNKGERSFAGVDNPAVILDTVKYAEDGSKDLIVRLYESRGSFTKTKISFGFDIKEAYITNMIEENLENANAENNEISVALNAFEVKTIKIKVKGNKI